MKNIPLFQYKGRDKNGEVVSGTMETYNIDEVIFYLKKQNIIPLKIEPIKQNLFSLKKHPFFRIGSYKIEKQHVMNFCRQLSLLNDTGIPLTKAIQKLADSSTSQGLRSVLNTVASDIAAGMSLSSALSKHTHAFSSIVVNIVEVGENTGNLSEVLMYLSRYLEASIANKRRFLSAIRYPTFVIATALAAIIAMNFLVIPKFTSIFSRFKLELPLATRTLIWSSDLMLNNKIAIFVIIVFVFFGLKRILKIPGVCYFWDHYKLKIPLVGPLLKRITISQFSWAFGLILHSGVPIIKGLGLASQTTGNRYFQSKIMKMSQAIEQGENLSRAAIASGLFTPITIQMIEIGEESEKLDEMLQEISKYYDAEIEYDLSRLNQLMEPILIGIIGVIVLIMALGIYFPMWDLIKVANI